MAAAIGGNMVTLKLEYTDGEIRRVSFPMTPSPAGQPYQGVYALLLAHLQKKLGQHQAFSMGYFDVDDDFVSISDANDLAEAIAQVRPSPAVIAAAGGALIPLAGAIDAEGKRAAPGHGHAHGGGNDGTVLKIKVLVHQYEILKIVEDGVVGAVTPAGPPLIPPPSAAGGGAAVGRLPIPPATPPAVGGAVNPPRSPVLAPANVPLNYGGMGVPSPQHQLVAAHDDELRWLRTRVTDLTEQFNRLQSLVQTLLPAEGRPHTGVNGAVITPTPPGGAR